MEVWKRIMIPKRYWINRSADWPTWACRFRFKPIPFRPELVVGGGYAVTTVKDPTAQTQLSADRDIADLGVTYYQKMTDNIYYFAGALLRTFFPGPVKVDYFFDANFNFFIIHRTNNRKFSFYPGLSYGLGFKPSDPRFDNPLLIKTIEQLFAFAGAQYAPNRQFNFFYYRWISFKHRLKKPSVGDRKGVLLYFSLGSQSGVLRPW